MNPVMIPLWGGEGVARQVAAKAPTRLTTRLDDVMAARRQIFHRQWV